MARYEQLTEDLHDLAVVAERREEEPISFDEVKTAVAHPAAETAGHARRRRIKTGTD